MSCAAAVWHSPRRDPDAEAVRFLKLWLAADEAREAGGSRVVPEGEATPVPQGQPADGATSAPGTPVLVRGRDEIIRQMILGLNPEHVPGRPQVLGGVAGVGQIDHRGRVVAADHASRARIRRGGSGGSSAA